MIVTVDFETGAIEPRPNYPPEPCGVALRAPSGDSGYLAWGHPSGNNCSRADGRRDLLRIWEDESVQLLFHNAPFDVSVGVEKLDLPMPAWHRIHDTRILLFLHDPHSKNLSLKPACEELLDWPAEERDELYEWVWTHRKELVAEYGGKITRAKTGSNSAGAWIDKVPGGLVGKYAVGDVERTYRLFRYLLPIIRSAGMMDAYDRERRLMPILLENERSGLRVDEAALRQDTEFYQHALHRVENDIRGYLRAPELNLDADSDVADVFMEREALHEDMIVLTPKSKKISVAKDNLPPEAFKDPLLASAFGYRNRLVTCLKMFMLPWLEQAGPNNGFVHTSWNAVRSSRGGARTGRPSMSRPNLLNVSKAWDDKHDGYVHPTQLDLPELPLVRKYVMADPEQLFVHRDFDGQELRIFAHFECGELQEAYLRDANLDPHDWVRQRALAMTGKDLDRTSVKVLNFQSLYGGGVTAISGKLKCSRAEAKQFKAFHDQALPGRKILDDEIKRIVRRGEPIRTWGGRLYYVEPPTRIKGRMQTWEYKLINYLVQGSAADVTKEAICRWYEGGGASNGTRFLLTVYDEINVSAPRAVAQESMDYLREVMNGVELDVPMRSSGKWGERWGALEKTT